MSRPFWRSDGEDVIVAVRLTPRGPRDAIGGLWRDEHEACWLQATVRAVPEKGRANDALIRLMAKALNMPLSSIRLESGESSRQKRLRIACPAASIEAMLQGWMTS